VTRAHDGRGAPTAGALDFRCPTCHASPGARCRTLTTNRYATAVHVARLLPRFRCPVCGTVTEDVINAPAGYCETCADWTGGKPPSAGQDALPGL
jgi:hypothetical protein